MRLSILSVQFKASFEFSSQEEAMFEKWTWDNPLKLVILWNLWDARSQLKKVFLSKRKLYRYLVNRYKLSNLKTNYSKDYGWSLLYAGSRHNQLTWMPLFTWGKIN